MKGEGERGECSQTIPNLQSYEDQPLHQQQEISMQQPLSSHLPLQPQSCADMFESAGKGSSSSSSGPIFPPDPSHLLPWTLSPVHSFSSLPSHFPPNNESPFFIPSHHPPIVPPSYGGLLNWKGPPLHHQLPYDGLSLDHHHHLRILSNSIGPLAGSGPFGLQAELGKMTAQEVMDAKALAASKSHSEAERRRRERINNHMAKLRSLLPSTTKTDKASLLAEVIQHVKELKRQTSIISEENPIPTEADELQVDTADEDGKFVIKASLCCEDRSDLLPELIKTLKALRLRTLKAEITTLGGRVKNVLFVTGEDQLLQDHHPSSSSNNNIAGEELPLQYSLGSIQEALKGVIERPSGDETTSGSVKRQRTNVNNSMIQQQQHQVQHLNRSL